MIETDIIIIGAGPVGLFAVFEAGLLKLQEIKAKFSKNKIYYSDTAMQLNESSICGYLCLKFIEWMIVEKKTFYEFLSKCMMYSNRYRKDIS